MSLPTDAAARKAAPMAEGLLWYFPNALAEVARVSKAGNDQHNPGQPMHHARGKSTDHADCIMRHLVDAGTIDTDGQRHTAKVAWRALALLQEELEAAENLPLPRNAKPPIIPHGIAAAALRDGVFAPTLAVAAGEPATGGGASSQITPLEPRLAGIADEEPPLRACATGGCGDE